MCKCFIVPPHILRRIAQHGDPAQSETALNTLALDGTMRTRRITTSVARSVPLAGPHGEVLRTVYTSGGTQQLPGHAMRSEHDPAVADVAVDQAFDGLGAVFDFYLKAYQRDSINDLGMALNASVHFGHLYDNAFWNGSQMVFGDGDGKIFRSFTSCLDVIGHELTHGVTASEVNLDYSFQSGALNESVSDVFGSLTKQFMRQETAAQADWLIGEGLLTFPGQALRSMKAPGTAYDNPLMGTDDQPATMAGYVHTWDDNGGVHTNSGIPNHAFYLAAMALGGNAWENAGQIWYDTITDRSLSHRIGFAAFAAATVKHAGHRHGATSTEAKAVRDAWQRVGIKVR